MQAGIPASGSSASSWPGWVTETRVIGINGYRAFFLVSTLRSWAGSRIISTGSSGVGLESTTHRIGKVGDPTGRRGTPGRSVLRVARVQPGLEHNTEKKKPQRRKNRHNNGMLEL